jgi:anti-anti-sigma factor
MEFAISCDVSPPTALVAVHGDLDVFGVSRLARSVGEAVRRGARQVLLDLGATTFVDVAAISQLARVLVMVRANDGDLTLATASPAFRRACTLAGMEVAFRLAEGSGPPHRPRSPETQGR